MTMSSKLWMFMHKGILNIEFMYPKRLMINIQLPQNIYGYMLFNIQPQEYHNYMKTKTHKFAIESAAFFSKLEIILRRPCWRLQFNEEATRSMFLNLPVKHDFSFRSDGCSYIKFTHLQVFFHAIEKLINFY